MSAKSKSSVLDRITPILFLAVIAMAFAIGALWQKINILEKGSNKTSGTQAGVQASPSGALAQSPTLDATSLKKYAKDLGLNDKDFASCLDSGKYATAVSEDLKQGESLNVTGTPSFFINGKFLGGAFPFEAFKDVIDKELAGTGSTNYKDYAQVLQQAYEQGKAFDPTPKSVAVGSAPVKGDANAKITIVEFSDFQCPYCARFFTQTYPQIEKDYIDTGKVKLVFKQFPIAAIHQYAQKAAEASLCAKDQGKFWEYHDKLFLASGS